MEFRKNYLAEVLVRIDLSGPAPWVDKLPRGLKEAARQQFPVMEVANALQIKMSANGAKGRFATEQGQYKEWVFHTVDRKRHLRIGPEWILVVCDKSSFTTYEESILAGLKPVWEAVCEQPDVPMPARLGLRYVNHIPRLDDTRDSIDWRDVVRNSARSVLNAPGPKDKLVRAVGVAEYNYGDHMLRFQFGMHNPDYPAPLSRPVFLLDYDCYSETLTDADEALDKLNVFREDILAVFIDSISVKLRQHLQSG